MNQEKFCTNFDTASLQSRLKRMLIGKDGVSFLQWSGLLINSCTLEVQADYSRYLNDHLCSTLTVSRQQKPGRKLNCKLRAYMRPKCNPIFFDSTINSPATIKLNVYQAFVLCAMKFHCCVRELSTWCDLHPKTFLTCIEGSLRYMYKLMKRRMFKVNPTSANQPRNNKFARINCLHPCTEPEKITAQGATANAETQACIIFNYQRLF